MNWRKNCRPWMRRCPSSPRPEFWHRRVTAKEFISSCAATTAAGLEVQPGIRRPAGA